MRIITNKSTLLESINIVQKAVPSKTTLPILEGILFQAKNGKLTLVSTDLEMGIETTSNVDVIEQGSTVVSSKIIGEIVRKLPDSDVEIETKDNFVYIKSENSEFKVLCLSRDEFPELPNVSREKGLSLTNSMLKEMIKQTIVAVSNDEIRPILTGVLLEIAGDQVTMVALDGFRMAVKVTSALNDENFKAVIPGKTLIEIGKILDESEEPVSIFLSKNQVLFQTGDTTVISRLLEGEFINYKQLLPTEYKTKIALKTEHLLDACERAALFARDSNNSIKFEVYDDIMNIKSNSDNGDVHEEVKISKNGEDIEIAFNPKYLIDALRVIGRDEITIEFTTSVSPSIIKPAKDSGFLYLILPVRRR
ncbi:DNA polymerase III subunit beta [Lutispora saccharofermentans]|uniref:Beta sliding clamp n=2 Tax=root TaxID=1 RepID=A0ABT1NKR3_9FIRM|nr:DNA polymerase III subunit beta [Lutispora saccharofermentans]MCQ1531684.1 DNA polymerase III subunit beta [Lutispora saccharofermentans]